MQKNLSSIVVGEVEPTWMPEEPVPDLKSFLTVALGLLHPSLSQGTIIPV